MLKRQPTPDDLLASLNEFIPGFSEAWRDSLFLGDDGSFTVHGVFSEFSAYMKGHFTEIAPATWEALLRYVEQCITSDPHSANRAGNAACTCFLENIASEGELSEILLPHLGPESKKYFDNWNN